MGAKNFKGNLVAVATDLDVGALSTDTDIKRALAAYLNVAEAKFRDYTVDRHETGNLTVRPEAVFG